jgi:hypothetical protein
MPQRGGSDSRFWMALVLRVLGLCIFAAAFFLPACRLGAPGPGEVVFPGWKCASVALSETMSLFGKSVSGAPPFQALLVVMSGWINPLIVLVLLASFSRRLLMARRVMGVVVLVCMAATWTFFAQQKLVPLLGHFLWIAGALLILLPEALSLCVRKDGN